MPNPIGKTALVTGASVGLGRDLAYILAEDGHDLVVTARNEAQLEALASELKAKFGVRVEVIVEDLAKPQAAARMFDEIAARKLSIDILINNAGFGGHGPFNSENLDEVLGMVQVNIAALTHLTRLFLPQMIERGGGRIMNVASVAGFLPGPFMAIYFATKAYVLSFSEAISSELKHTGVTVTALCPGSTATEFHQRAGIDKTRLFQGRRADSMTVCRIGYRGMMKGRRVVITGLGNKISVWAVRILPKWVVLAVVRKANQDIR